MIGQRPGKSGQSPQAFAKRLDSQHANDALRDLRRVYGSNLTCNPLAVFAGQVQRVAAGYTATSSATDIQSLVSSVNKDTDRSSTRQQSGRSRCSP
jgi:hypothetical protein